MTNEQYLKNLEAPAGKIDVVLDTDAYNEIDDQFAVAYMLKYKNKLNVKKIYAAPFYNSRSSGPEDGMLKSYDEIVRLLKLAGENELCKSVLHGSRGYLRDEKTPVASPAADDLVRLALSYSPENPLYVVAIGAATNIASALLINPDIAENIVIVWLGGHARHWCDTKEFNMKQDIAAARVVMSSAAPFVQLPCCGVVSEFSTSAPELRYWLSDKNPLADYLCENTVREAERCKAGMAWTRVIWDVTAVAWLLNDNDRFMRSEVTDTFLPGYDFKYEVNPLEKKMRYVTSVNRDKLMSDLFFKLTDK